MIMKMKIKQSYISIWTELKKKIKILTLFYWSIILNEASTEYYIFLIYGDCCNRKYY